MKALTFVVLVALSMLAGCGQGAKDIPSSATTKSAPAPAPSAGLSVPSEISKKRVVPLDTNAYPQDTPRNALGSVIKSLDKQAIDYFISWLVLPSETKRLLDKNEGDIDKAAAKSLQNPERLKNQKTVFQQYLDEGALEEVEAGEHKATRFKLKDRKEVLQFELVEGRWCFNPLVRGPEATPASASPSQDLPK